MRYRLSRLVPMRFRSEFVSLKRGVRWRVHWWQWRDYTFRRGGTPEAASERAQEVDGDALS